MIYRLIYSLLISEFSFINWKKLSNSKTGNHKVHEAEAHKFVVLLKPTQKYPEKMSLR